MAADNLPPLSLDAAPLFSMRGISKAFGDFMALSGVDLDLNAGEIHCLLGENGAGKSTLCNLIFGVHAPSDGKMNYLGAPHDPGGPRDALDGGIAMVHQHFSLSPDLSALDNLLLGSTLKRLNRKSAQARQAIGRRADGKEQANREGAAKWAAPHTLCCHYWCTTG